MMIKYYEMIKLYDLNESNKKRTHYVIVNYDSYQIQDVTGVTTGKHSLDTNKNVKKC